MLELFASTTASDPANNVFSYYFTQGVLGITVIILILTVRFMFTYYNKKLDDKDLKIEALQNARLDDNKTHTVDYREMAKNDQAVLLGVAQSQELLSGKIEAVKGRR